MKLKIASYNIWYGANELKTTYTERGGIASTSYEPENVSNFLYDYDIDICGMQEVDVNVSRSNGDDQPALFAKTMTERTGRTYYSAFGAGLSTCWARKPLNPDRPAGYGNCIVSKYPIVSSEVIKVHKFPVNHPDDQAKEGYEQRALLVAKIDVDGKIITVMTTHFDLKEDARWMMLDAILEQIDKADGPVVLMGDFNMRPGDPILKKIEEKLEKTGDGETPPTFDNRNPRWKIDFIYRSASLACHSLTVPTEVNTSDHLPLVAELELAD